MTTPHDDPFQLERPLGVSGSSLSASDLEHMGKRASALHLAQGAPLDRAVVQIVREKQGSLTTHHVRRVVEAANVETFQRHYEKGGSAGRVVDFELVDPERVLSELNLEKTAAASPVHEDYARGPEKRAARRVEAELELARAFGRDLQPTPTMEKTAAIFGAQPDWQSYGDPNLPFELKQQMHNDFLAQKANEVPTSTGRAMLGGGLLGGGLGALGGSLFGGRGAAIGGLAGAGLGALGGLSARATDSGDIASAQAAIDRQNQAAELAQTMNYGRLADRLTEEGQDEARQQEMLDALRAKQGSSTNPLIAQLFVKEANVETKLLARALQGGVLGGLAGTQSAGGGQRLEGAALGALGGAVGGAVVPMGPALGGVLGGGAAGAMVNPAFDRAPLPGRPKQAAVGLPIQALRGALAGALAGAQEAGPDQRIMGAALGAAMGALGGPAMASPIVGGALAGGSLSYMTLGKGSQPAVDTSKMGAAESCKCPAGGCRCKTNALVKQAMSVVRSGRPGAELVVRDLEQMTALDAIKRACADRRPLPQAEPYAELVKTSQRVNRLLADAQAAVGKNRELIKEAEAGFAHEAGQFVLQGRSLAELAHALAGAATSGEQVKLALRSVLPKLVARRAVDLTKEAARGVRYEMEKGARVRPVNPDHPLITSFSALCRLSTGQAEIEHSAEKLGQMKRDLDQEIARASSAKRAAA